MCTAIRYGAAMPFFGRTLDYHRSFGETVTVMPRRYPLVWVEGGREDAHYSVIGMTADLNFSGGYPLFYDGVNEKGLAMAGLNFTQSAVYVGAHEGKRGVAVHEVIPYILGKCASVDEAREALSDVRITDVPFGFSNGKKMPSARLHWMLADQKESMVVESVREGLMCYPNPVGVLANEPPFPVQLAAREKRSEKEPLPMDFSSPSRFLRGSAALAEALDDSREGGAEDFFRIMAAVSLPWEGTLRQNGVRWFTLYTCCMALTEGRYLCAPRGTAHVLSAALSEENVDGTECVACFSL